MTQKSLLKSLAILVAVTGVLGRPNGRLVARADPPAALEENAPDDAIKFQPVLDYDTDSCYNVAAIDADGNVAEGLEPDGGNLTGDCRDEADLDNQNVYSRTRCNNDWCVAMYEHYFERDATGSGSGGHIHDWENIVVGWKKGAEVPEFVAASAHDGYSTKAWSDIQQQDSHAKIVYHKDGGSTHAFRFAKTDGGDEPPENHRAEWIRGSLVDYNGYPSEDVRQKLFDNWPPGAPSPKIQDASFKEYLDKAVDGDWAPGFDTGVDE